MRAFLQATRGEAIDNDRADAFEQMANPIERRHQSPEGEDTERGKAVGSREGEKLGDQITEQNNDRENYRGGEPLGNLCRHRHYSRRRRWCNRPPSKKVNRALLPIIAGAPKLRPS